jgi:LacI family transcriptional regulator
VNIAEVARLAGVSTATVSRVINCQPFVKEMTRQKVLQTIKETNYRVNAVARNLRRKKTHSVGVIISNVLSPFYSVIAKSVEDVALGNSYSVVLCNGGDIPEKELQYLKVLHENRVDGIILSPTGKNTKYLKFLVSCGVPVCLIDRLVKGLESDTVLVNNREASKQAVGLLIERGYRRIGFISGPTDRTTGVERMKGYVEAHREHNMPVEKRLIRYGDFSLESGRDNAAHLLEKNGLDALYVSNTDMAMGAYQLIKERGMAIPDDIGFVMFDDPDWTRLVFPQVTAVSQPVYNLGSTAADLLFKRIHEGKDYKDKGPVKLVLEAKLMVRGSA